MMTGQDQEPPGPEGYVTEETYNECNEDRLAFLRLLSGVLPLVVCANCRAKIEKEIAERTTESEREDASLNCTDTKGENDD